MSRVDLRGVAYRTGRLVTGCCLLALFSVRVLLIGVFGPIQSWDVVATVAAWILVDAVFLRLAVRRADRR